MAAIQTLTFGVTGALLFVGTAVYLWLFSRERGGVALYVVPAAITFIAGVAYTVMALSAVGYLGDIVLEARYVDWLLTTPLIVFTLATVAGAADGVKLKAMSADAAMIVFGYVASVMTGAVKWAGFLASSVAFAIVVYYLITALTDSASEQPPAVESMFLGLRDLTVFLWFAFPLLWLLGPDGFGFVQRADHEFLLAFMDLTAKAGFNLIIALRAQAIRTTLGAEYLGTGPADAQSGVPE